MTRKHGGKRVGAGRRYSPWSRIELADRFAELRWQIRAQGVQVSSTTVWEILHAELHRGGGGDILTTKRLAIVGRMEGNYLNDLDAKLCGGEPLNDYDLEILRKLRRRRPPTKS